MKKQILNLGKALSKVEQKQVFGGMVDEFGGCRLTTITNGVHETYLIMGMSNNGGSQTAAAEIRCGELLIDGADRCFYDCTYDN